MFLKKLIPFKLIPFNKHSVYLCNIKHIKTYMGIKTIKDSLNQSKTDNQVSDDMTKTDNQVSDDMTKTDNQVSDDMTKTDNQVSDGMTKTDNQVSDGQRNGMTNIIGDDLTKINYDDIDLMDYIDEDDQRILKNKRLFKMTAPDWGMSLGITNQYIQGSLLKLKYDTVYCDYDEIKSCGFDITSNIYGFDIIFKKNNKFYTVQSKLRQVRGNDAFSCRVNITTSRRRGNIKHVPYLKTDFDYLFVSLVNIKENTDNRKDVNKWGFSFIPVEKLIDPNNTEYLLKNVPTSILNEYKIDFKKKMNDKMID